MGKCVGVTVVALSVLLSLIWTILICLPTGWHTKSTLIWNFNVGLYYVKVDRAIVGSIAHMGAGLIDFTTSAVRKKKTTVLGDALGHITEGEESLRFYRDMFCNMGVLPMMNMNCAPWEHLLIGSWVMLLSTIITIILLLCGAGFMYYYEFHNARKKTRKWAMGFLAFGAFVNLMGMGAYVGLTFQFGNWLQEMMLSSSRCTFSFIFVMAIMIHLFTWAPCLICWTCAGSNEKEDIAEEMAWEKKKLMYGFDDEYAGEEHYDEYGNPVSHPQYDESGNPIPKYDAYGNPLPQQDAYGNSMHGSYHTSAYSEHEMHPVGGGSYHADPYAQGSYHTDPYSQGSGHGDPYAQGQGSYHAYDQAQPGYQQHPHQPQY